MVEKEVILKIRAKNQLKRQRRPENLSESLENRSESPESRSKRQERPENLSERQESN